MKKALILALSLFSMNIFANTTDFTISAEKSGVKGSFATQELTVSKSDKSNRINFTASGSAADVFHSTIEYKGNIFQLELDNVNKQVVINGFTQQKSALVVTKEVQSDIKKMLHAAQLNADNISSFQSTLDSESNITLLKFFEFLATYPINQPIQQKLSAATGPQIQGWTNICSSMGSRKTAVWDLDRGSVKRKSYVVGGHGFCAGRCGAGCPTFGDGQYTQDCLNHDACADVEGEQLGNCSDEWRAASDDFWFSPDCETPHSS
ncbi:hypothetical protein PCIT_a3291 [Pseudoalteromonas citrea]|uniref:DUF8213 domain-containing protein n=2 Tax=Pseudoalteromonas citrea TaxID=43655 RepID=A0AAD4AGR7_9GAMM|nr:hypothetical protein [Pseudoalteromonas citrea]KAF7768793.1 hypothetical protein PCIT_a3291 [Pseudoalteromonas citrea]